MNLPNWVHETIRKFVAPPTGKVVIELECYQNGVTKMEIGGVTRTKPSDEFEKQDESVIHQIIRRR
jgi:hypothetical protein